jgi:PhnB protein
MGVLWLRALTHREADRVTAIQLGYDDIEAARDFFTTALGFTEEWSIVDEAGILTRSHVRFEETVLMLDRPGAHGVKSPREVGGVTHLLVIEVPDADEHFRRAVAANAEILAPPTDRPWGRDFEVRDPGGYVFSVFSAPRT